MEVVVGLLLLLLLLHFSAAATPETLDAQDLEKEALGLLTPLMGNVDVALRKLIDNSKVGMGVTTFINIVAKRVFNLSPNNDNFGSSIPAADRKLLALFEVLSRRLDQMEYGVHGVTHSLRNIATGLQDLVRWEIALNTMEDYTRCINTFYNRFLFYQKLKDKVENHTLLDFANAIVSHDPHSVTSSMVYLHSMAAPEAAHTANSPLFTHLQLPSKVNDPKSVYSVSGRVTTKTAFYNLLKSVVEWEDMPAARPSLFIMLGDALKMSDVCQLRQSKQQLMKALHQLLTLAQARGYIMLEFAWMLLRVHDQGNFTAEHEVTENLYLQYSDDIMREAKKAITDQSREYWRCDPRQHSEGDTYIQLTELLQGYIENEVDMNSVGSCSQTCGYYQHAHSEGCYMSETQYCGKHRRCQGTLHDCQYNYADSLVCLSRKPYRRYDSIVYNNGLRLGSSESCGGSLMRVDSWWRFLYHCSYCYCLCDDGNSPTSNRYISLVAALSDTRSNMVVTGLQFTKQRKVIHLQVQQGEALPQGHVNMSTIHWVDVEPINILSMSYDEGRHYKKLSFEERSIDLDRLVAPENHVVTGVRFRMLGSHVNLEVQITPVNYTTGKLQAYKSYWISNDNTPAMSRNSRKEFVIYSPDDPARFITPSQNYSRPDTFIRFGPTDRRKDAAQLTVPFLDAQTVAPFPSTWFSGVELYHKGQPGSGGFLGLKVITYDASLHMEFIDYDTMAVNLHNLPNH